MLSTLRLWICQVLWTGFCIQSQVSQHFPARCDLPLLAAYPDNTVYHARLRLGFVHLLCDVLSHGLSNLLVAVQHFDQRLRQRLQFF